jgi:hypothetical protein
MELHTLSVAVSEFLERDKVTFYKVEVYHSTTKSSWVVNRRFSEFDSLFNSLNHQFMQIPTLPGKGFWKKFSSTFLEDRKSHLNDFVTEITSRQELLQTTEVQEFFELRRNIQGLITSQVDEISHQKVNLVPFALISIDLDYCFLALNPNALDRLKFTLMESEQSSLICQKTSGEILWSLKFPFKITCAGYSKQLTILGIGFENGGISAYRVKSELDYTEYEEFSYILPHSLSVIGLILDYHTSDFYTCSEDKKIKKLNMQHEVVLQQQTLDSVPSDFFSDMSTHQLFVVNSKTGMTIFDCNTLIPVLAISAHKMFKACTTGEGILFIGYLDAGVNVYKDSVLVTNLPITGRVTCVRYSSVRREVFIGTDSGYLSVWTRNGKMLRIWKGHEKAVSSVETIGNLVMTGGLEGNIISWRLPVFWTDPEFERIEQIESEIQAKTMRVLKTQRKIKEADDLKGWDKS